MSEIPNDAADDWMDAMDDLDQQIPFTDVDENVDDEDPPAPQQPKR